MKSQPHTTHELIGRMMKARAKLKMSREVLRDTLNKDLHGNNQISVHTITSLEVAYENNPERTIASETAYALERWLEGVEK